MGSEFDCENANAASLLRERCNFIDRAKNVPEAQKFFRRVSENKQKNRNLGCSRKLCALPWLIRSEAGDAAKY